MRKLKKQLFAAVVSGDIATVRKLLQDGISPDVVNSVTEKRTLLMTAAINNDALMVKLLLENKANAELMDYQGRDAFDYAEKFNANKALLALLQYSSGEDDIDQSYLKNE